MARKKKPGCSLPLVLGLMLAALWSASQGNPIAPPSAAGESAPEGGGKPSAGPVDAPAPRPRHKPVPSPFAETSPWASPAACEAVLRKQRAEGKQAVTPRIGTWNLAWFPAGTARGDDPERARDVPWMACVIATLGVQVLAVQEVVQNPRGRAALLDLLQALSKHTSGRWRAELDECPDDGRQHVGFLFDEARVELSSMRVLPELNPDRSACDHQLRPGFAARFRYLDAGPDFDAISLHLDSGVLARDHGNRQTSVARLAGSLRALPSIQRKQDDDVIVLGDLNTMGCETCTPKVEAGDEIAALDAAADAYHPSLQNLAPEHGCSHYYRGHGGRLDHVLVTRGMQELEPAAAAVRVHGACEALRCEKHSGVARLPASEKLSDHCPLVLTLQRKDLD